MKKYYDTKSMAYTLYDRVLNLQKIVRQAIIHALLEMNVPNFDEETISAEMKFFDIKYNRVSDSVVNIMFYGYATCHACCVGKQEMWAVTIDINVQDTIEQQERLKLTFENLSTAVSELVKKNRNRRYNND